MRSRIIKIGNSRGILIPKALIKKTGLGAEAQIRVERNTLVVQPVARPRTGWDAAFKKMADTGDDTLLDSEVHLLTSWEKAEWQW